MPHITLEYTSNIHQPVDFNTLFRNLHHILAEKGAVNIDNCKSRAVMRNHFLIGEGDPEHAFVHVDVQILEGRDQTWIDKIGPLFLGALDRAYSEVAYDLELQTTVSFRDLERERYFKHSAGILAPQ